MTIEEIADAFERASDDSAAAANDRRPASVETTMDRLTRDLRLGAAARPGAEYFRRQPEVCGRSTRR